MKACLVLCFLSVVGATELVDRVVHTVEALPASRLLSALVSRVQTLQTEVTEHPQVRMPAMKKQALDKTVLKFQKYAASEDVKKIHLPEMGVTVIRTASTDRCYISPLSEANHERVLTVATTALSKAQVEKLAGPYGAQFCQGLATYLLKDIQRVAETPRRHKRQNDPSALDLSYEERNPRCMDVILDCADDAKINEVQSCYTWVNGIAQIAQKCNSATEFTFSMNKPPGRILKIMQQQSIICDTRRKDGLRC